MEMSIKTSHIKIDISELAEQLNAPAFESEGEVLFWNDPYISQQMLLTHLDPATDLASRKPEIIDRTIEWITADSALASGSKIIDLGCGPGLYTSRLAKKGFQVTGVDFSTNSIAYAVEQARVTSLSIDYIEQDYRNLAFEDNFDAALLIYYDLGVLSNRDTEVVLGKVFKALKPGGILYFDVVTQYARGEIVNAKGWEVNLSGGFWRPGAHIVLSQVLHYPENCAYLDQYFVIDDQGKLFIYRLWEHYYTIERLQSILTRIGFTNVRFWEDLMGSPFHHKSGAIGVAARK
jgi:SAM-dependent methyltransferase